MINLGDIIIYLIDAVSHERKLIEQTLLLLLIYLCDWHSCVKYNRRFTNVQWLVSKYGLADEGLESYVRQHTETFRSDDVAMTVECLPTTLPVLSEFQLAVAKRVVSIYESYAPFGLMTFVMSTYPILSASSEKLERIDILTMAQTYNKLLKQDSTSA